MRNFGAYGIGGVLAEVVISVGTQTSARTRRAPDSRLNNAEQTLL
jgi:hypothetical protein